jgi:hypothetical protein
MWPTSAGGQLIEVANLTGFTVYIYIYIYNFPFLNTLSKSTEVSNFVKIYPVVAELFHVDRQTDTMKLQWLLAILQTRLNPKNNYFKHKYLGIFKSILPQAPRRVKQKFCLVMYSCVGNKSGLAG